MRPPSQTVAIVGGGLAGLAAAVAAAEHGLRVELFEARRQLGGRAGALHDPHVGGPIDLCQHVALGCCTNLVDFARRIGLCEPLHWHTKLHFIGPDGTQYDFCPSQRLPAPLHLLPALMQLKYLTLTERWQIAQALGRLAGEHIPEDSEQTIGQWLRQRGQSERMIERFWSVILLGALSETLDRASVCSARKAIVDGLLASPRAYHLEASRLTWSVTSAQLAAGAIENHGGRVHRGTRVRAIEGDGARARALVLGDGSRQAFDFVILAVPWHRIGRLLPPVMLGAMPELAEVKNIPAAAITAVHLWFDRPIAPLPHAVLVGRISQWVFYHGVCELLPQRIAHYYQVVISASHDLLERPRAEVLRRVCDDLKAIWPEARGAELLHSRVITHRSAVFSPRPGVERLRPAQQTSIPNLMLAGDWTATGWPATMESAVRSGYLAVEAVLAALGRAERILVPDLPRGRLARWLCGPPEVLPPRPQSGGVFSFPRSSVGTSGTLNLEP